MRQGDGSDLLGANDPRSASIGIIYVAPTDDRSSVLEAIFMQDKLGRKQIAVVLPENNRAFQRSVDFDGMKNLRRGLKSEIIFIAPGVPGPAEFARQRRFSVYTSLESYTTALRSEPSDNANAKKGLVLFGRKPRPTGSTSRVEEPNGKGSAQPLPVSPLPVPVPVDSSDKAPAPNPTLPPDDATSPSSSPNGNVSHVDNGTDAAGNGSAKPVYTQREAEPIIFAPPLPRPRTTAKLAAASAAGAGAATTIPKRSGNTGKRAAVGVGAAAAGAGAALAATGSAPAAGGGPPPTRGNAGGPGGGGGGSSRSGSRQLLAILLVILTLLLLAGIAFASPMGQNVVSHIFTGSTQVNATVTITPDSQTVADSFVITAVTGTPNPSARQVQARIPSYTSPSQSASANATGSIPGTRATGLLTFANIGNGVTVSGGTLTGADGVQIAFGSVYIPFGAVTVSGTAVNAGVSGNIPALDINGPCCGSSNIHVRNNNSFSGGQNAQPNSVISQNDINAASNKLIASLKPSAQTALQQQVTANEQVVDNSLNCTSNVNANHRAGDQAKSVSVTGTVTCTEEVFDRQAAFTIATTALSAEAGKTPGAGYVLQGKVATNVTHATVIDARHTVSLVVSAQGLWVYQFSSQLQQQLKDTIAQKSKSAALTYLKAVTGVSSVDITLSSGDTLPDATHISIVIKTITGGNGTPTVTPGSPSPAITPTSTPLITPSTGLGGS